MLRDYFICAAVIGITLAALAGLHPARAAAIPPNCTLNPWTGKLTCHVWPSCHMDMHGHMVCPEGNRRKAE